MDSDGSDVRQLTDNPTNDWNPSWSPDGSLIAFERYDCAVDAPPGEPSCTTGEDMELYVMAADGTSEVRLRNNAVDEYWPSWSPDGGWIVFVRDGRRGDLNIFKMRSDGSDVTKLTRGARSDRSPSWAPG
jgi:TolB protein